MANTDPMSNKSQVEQVQVSLDHLTHILSRLAPVITSPPSLFGTAPHFIGANYCWIFESGGSDLYRQVAEVISKFRGTMRWNFNREFNQKGACIAALASSSEFYSPVLGSRPIGNIKIDRRSLTDEIDALCSFMEVELGVVGQESKSSSNNAAALGDEYDLGVYDVTLVRDVKRFRWPTPTSEVDKRLNVGLTYEEWYALFFQVLGRSRGTTEAHPMDFQGEIDGYPILSRLNDIHDDAAVEASEVGELESECLRLESISKSNPVAYESLRKLLLICRWAEDLRAGIYFSGK